jgi:hypothetical protein
MNLPADQVACSVKNDIFYVFTAVKNNKKQIRLVDHKGFIKVQRADGEAVSFKAKDWEEETEKMWKRCLTYKAEMERTPDLYLCLGGKVMDYANTVSLEQLKVIMSTEFADAEPEDDVILIGARSEL